MSIKEFLRPLKEDEEFRFAITALLSYSETAKRLNQHKKPRNKF